MGLEECIGGSNFSTHLPLNNSSLAALAVAESACSLCSPSFLNFFSFSFLLPLFIYFCFNFFIFISLYLTPFPFSCVITSRPPPEPHSSATSLPASEPLHTFAWKAGLHPLCLHTPTHSDLSLKMSLLQENPPNCHPQTR